MLFVSFLVIHCVASILCVAPDGWHHLQPPEGKKGEQPPSDTFEDALMSSVCVDKSGFIREFFESKESLYLCAPHGFGKSTLSNMLRRFAEVKVDVNGTRIDSNTTSGFNMFLDKRLEVTKNASFFHAHFAQYPVLQLKFKYMVAHNSRSEFERFFRSILVVAAQEHAYLSNSTHLTKEERDKYNAIYKNEFKTPIEVNAKDLTGLLHAHHKKKCIVLIDDFDTAVAQMLWSESQISIPEAEEVLNMLQKFLTTLMKHNDHLEKGLVMGCLRLVPTPAESETVASTSKDINGLRTVIFGEDEKFAKYFGYTDDEVKFTARRLNKDAYLDVIRAWYGGYAVFNSKVRLFNMISIAQFFKTGNMSGYWTDGPQAKDTVGMKYIFDYKIVGDEVQKSLSRETVRVMFETHYSTAFTVEAVRGLLKEVRKNKETKGESEIKRTELLVKYLIDHGYYSLWHESRSPDDRLLSATIPNYEIRGLLDGFIYTPLFYKSKYNLTEETIGAFIQAVFKLIESEAGYKQLAMATSTLIGFVPTRDGPSEWIRMLAVFTDYSEKFEFIGREMLSDKSQGQNLIIITKKPEHPAPGATGNHTGILIRVMADVGTAHDALRDIIRHGYYGIFEEKLKMLPVGHKILIGMHLNRDKMVNLCYLDGSINIESARTTSSDPAIPL